MTPRRTRPTPHHHRGDHHRRGPAVAAAGVSALTLMSLALAGPAGADDAAQAQPDSYTVRDGRTLTVTGTGVLRNDTGDLTTVVRHTEPTHGTLDLQPDGSFSYRPEAGFSGTDTFTYTTTDAVDLARTHLPPLATLGGVDITGGAYGSAVTPVPGHPGQVYGLTDRGPNVDGPNGTKVEPLPDFQPAIGRFRLTHGRAVLRQTIGLSAPDGTAYDGQVACGAGSTGETITDLDGTTLPCSDTGYDPEGLVALPDGTFWVSDEYGPFLTHVDRTGRQIGRIGPFDASLPAELSHRVPNRGMEGLTVTPDGTTLVGIMQSALQQTDLGSTSAKKVSPVRIVTYDLATGATHEYLYLLDNPGTTGTAVSEITAVSDHEFLVDERDGNLEPGAYKRLYRIDLDGATDVGPDADAPGATYDPSAGLLIGGRSIEATVGTSSTSAAQSTLAADGITVVSKTLDLDLGALVTSLDPSGDFFGHDKIEGVATTDGGQTLVISNDSDFGIDAVVGGSSATPPFQLHAKVLPDGRQDDGEYLTVDTTRLDDPVTTATVTIRVRAARG